MIGGRYRSMATALMRQRQPSIQAPQQPQGFFGMQQPAASGVSPFGSQPEYTQPVQPPASGHVSPFAGTPKPDYTQQPVPQQGYVSPLNTVPKPEFTPPVQPVAPAAPRVSPFGKRPEFTTNA